MTWFVKVLEAGIKVSVGNKNVLEEETTILRAFNHLRGRVLDGEFGVFVYTLDLRDLLLGAEIASMNPGCMSWKGDLEFILICHAWPLAPTTRPLIVSISIRRFGVDN
jgi:hypothetical protein